MGKSGFGRVLQGSQQMLGSWFIGLLDHDALCSQILPEHLLLRKWWLEYRYEWYRRGPSPKEPHVKVFAHHLARWEEWRAGAE